MTWESNTKILIVESSAYEARRRSFSQNIVARKTLLKGEEMSTASRKKEGNQKWVISSLQPSDFFQNIAGKK